MLKDEGTEFLKHWNCHFLFALIKKSKKVQRLVVIITRLPPKPELLAVGWGLLQNDRSYEDGVVCIGVNKR